MSRRPNETVLSLLHSETDLIGGGPLATGASHGTTGTMDNPALSVAHCQAAPTAASVKPLTCLR